MMRPVPLSVAVVLSACCMVPAAFAQSMPNSLNMSCAAASALVRERGAVVIGTGPNLFDRYVANQGYCSAQEQVAAPSWIQTRDQSQCFVGYRCREPYQRGN
ncbi:hypothetical protein [Ancylobacter amanitiformis]|uniref:YARHG domain-containing protein n=1 Tax=Ancylobacter amanitiformis TaxID=217069 RepID=A0ABU0LWH6_9HYPH|nr:hypothetical protein [Ancylobacter amanitiformis]MDQ0513079.1 hypothetical protein [Ancylobacter amanitiformis]